MNKELLEKRVTSVIADKMEKVRATPLCARSHRLRCVSAA
jgi:hypothetical protein